VHVVSGANGELNTIYGTAGDDFGVDACAIHDVDGDGVKDLLIGAKHHQNSVGMVGAAYVVSPVSGTVLRTHLGAHYVEYHGYGTAAVRDLDGDVNDTSRAANTTQTNLSGRCAFSGATGNAISKIEPRPPHRVPRRSPARAA
jgi:hypothetical protein